MSSWAVTMRGKSSFCQPLQGVIGLSLIGALIVILRSLGQLL